MQRIKDIIKRIRYNFVSFIFNSRYYINIYNNNKLIKKGLLEIGDYTYGRENINIRLYERNSCIITIGRFCSIAENCTMITGGIHPANWISTYPLSERFSKKSFFIKNMPFSKGNISIGNDVWIASDVTIHSGVTIGDGAIIAAGSIVVKDILPYSLVAGVPAKFIKYRFSNDVIEKLLIIKWWNFDSNLIEENIELLSSNRVDEFVKKYTYEDV